MRYECAGFGGDRHPLEVKKAGKTREYPKCPRCKRAMSKAQEVKQK